MINAAQEITVEAMTASEMRRAGSGESMSISDPRVRAMTPPMESIP